MEKPFMVTFGALTLTTGEVESEAWIDAQALVALPPPFRVRPSVITVTFSLQAPLTVRVSNGNATLEAA